MVAQPSLSIQTAENQETKSSGFKWTTVAVREVVEQDYRLEASVYSNDGRQARKDLEQCKWDVVHLGDEFIEDTFYGSRSKRIYINQSNKDAVGFLGSAEMLSVYPKPVKFILKKDGISTFSVKRGWILLSRSGTIGNVTFVNNTLKKYFISEHAIRISCTEYSGYIYAFLKSKIGRVFLESSIFGAVISQIEPQQLNHIPIPNPPPIFKQAIHNLIEESFKLRDESNELIDEAQALLKEALQLPDIEKLQANQVDQKTGVLNYSVPLSELDNRLDGSYHVPIVQAITRHLEKTAKEIVRVSDSRISQSVILPSHFKRIYVNESNGVTLIGGKHLNLLDPIDKKYLAAKQYNKELRKDMLLTENMIIVSAKGTPGKVAIVPRHWNGWFISSNLIKIVLVSDEIAGFLYCFLSSPYGEALIKRQIYGAVVDIIEPIHVKSIVVPFLKDRKIQIEINNKVLEANQKRTEAYKLE